MKTRRERKPGKWERVIYVLREVFCWILPPADWIQPFVFSIKLNFNCLSAYTVIMACE